MSEEAKPEVPEVDALRAQLAEAEAKVASLQSDLSIMQANAQALQTTLMVLWKMPR